MKKAVIKAQAVSKSFGTNKVLDSVDLEVLEGSVLALLGPNGAGKTTMVRILTTLLRPDEGSITVAGYDVLKEPDKVRSNIGLAGQNATVDGYLSGLQNLAMMGRLYRLSRKDARERAEELIEQFGLSAAAKRPVRNYSGGMRRRLDLAASLIVAPPILFLDEPTTGLDPESRNTAWEIIRKLVNDGTTLLLTTQYLEEADQLADDIAVIDHGHIIAGGTPAALKNKLGGERLEITLVNPGDVSKFSNISKRTLGSDSENGILSFNVKNGEAGLKEVSAILRDCIEAKVEVKDYTIHRPTLEEAFLKLVGSNNKRQEGDK